MHHLAALNSPVWKPMNPQHPTEWSFELLYAKPLLHANQRLGHQARARITRQIREEVYFRTRELKIPTQSKIRVQLTWIVATNRDRDEDNLVAFAKPIYDAIGSNRGLSARVVIDDAPRFMEKPTPIITYLKGAIPRFIVTITALSADSTKGTP